MLPVKLTRVSHKIWRLRHQNSGRCHNIKINNSCFESVEEFKYLGTTVANKNSIQEELKSRLKSGNAFFHSMQNLLSFSLLYKIIKIKIKNYNFAFCSVWV